MTNYEYDPWPECPHCTQHKLVRVMTYAFMCAVLAAFIFLALWDKARNDADDAQFYMKYCVAPLLSPTQQAAADQEWNGYQVESGYDN